MAGSGSVVGGSDGEGGNAPSGLAAAIIESAPDALLCVNDAGVIVLANQQVEHLFGFQRDELVGRLIEQLIPTRAKVVHAQHRAEYLGDPRSRPMGAGLELTALRKDGTEFPVDISLSSIETTDGLVVLAAIRDITERMQIQAERAHLEAQLVQTQREEERAVLEAQLYQAQRLESVGRLAGGIAHDFNNILAGIMNYATLVGDGLSHLTGRLGVGEDPDAVSLHDDVAEISNIATRAAQLIRQLLIFSRRDVVQPEVLDLNAIVQDMEKLLQRTIGESIDLRTRLDPFLPRVRADRGQIDQVIMNLAVNARDSMPHGGVLGIETARFRADDEYARVCGPWTPASSAVCPSPTQEAAWTPMSSHEHWSRSSRPSRRGKARVSGSRRCTA